MVRFSTLVVSSVALAVVSAVPLQKRIAQTISDSTADWEKACLAAGGGQQCNPLSITAFTSLLAAGKNCDQQDAADQMIDLAKTLKSDPEMIRLTQLFVQQPRNAPDSLQVPYCQTAPKNQELAGLFHCQFAGSNFAKFSGDQTGNLPLGVSAVNPPGSCPAKKDGPVPDGVQLNTLVQDPGLGTPAGVSSGNASTVATPPPAASSAAPASTASPVSAETTASAAPAAATSAAPAASSAPASSAGTSSFALDNGKDALALNTQFAALTPSSPCTTGQNACVNGQFAQCVGSSFVLTPCGGGLQCVALPLVNSRGTSVTCDTVADRDARIAATGASPAAKRFAKVQARRVGAAL